MSSTGSIESRIRAQDSEEEQNRWLVEDQMNQHLIDMEIAPIIAIDDYFDSGEEDAKTISDEPCSQTHLEEQIGDLEEWHEINEIEEIIDQFQNRKSFQ